MRLPDDTPETKFLVDLVAMLLTIAFMLALLSLAAGWIRW